MMLPSHVTECIHANACTAATRIFSLVPSAFRHLQAPIYSENLLPILYTFEMSVSTGIAEQPPLQQSTHALQDARQWLNECAVYHKQCTTHFKMQSTLVNLRLIDCTTRSIVLAPSDCRFVALSYVWGKDQTLYALGSHLPQTLEDSLMVTLALGFRYLWVDRYVCAACPFASPLNFT